MRIAELAKRYDELAADAQVLSPPPTPSFVPAPTPLHRALVGMLGRLLELGVSQQNASAPAYLRAMLRTLHTLEPMLAEELAAVPEFRVRLFLTDLRNSLDRVLSSPSGHADEDPDQPGANITSQG